MSSFFKIWRSSFLLPLLIITVAGACNSPNNRNAGKANDSNTDTAIGEWVSLYNGKDFTGWHTYGKSGVTSAWKAEDSAIHLSIAERDGWQSKNGGDLVTNEEYSNFDLKLEWKISKAGNSGVFFYVREDTDEFKNVNESGLEMQINDDANTANGQTEKQRAGDLVNLLRSSQANVVKPAGEWNQTEIKLDRGKLDFFMNGQHILYATLWDDSWQELIDNSKFSKFADYGTYKKGKIALQDHGEDVWFRNIMIRKL